MKFKIHYIAILLIIFLFSNNNVFSQDVTKSMEDYSKIYKGKIIKVNFVNKGGKEFEDIFDYFFEINDEKYFIKISEGKIKRDELAKCYNKEISVRAVLTSGLWDTDDHNVQSRVGEFIVFYEIK